MAYPVVPDIPSATLSGTTTTTDFPSGATQVIGTSGDVAASQAVATLAASATKKTYICGFDVTATGATGATVVDITVSDGTWTITYPLIVVAGATTQLISVNKLYDPPLVGSAINTSIVVTVPTLGTGNLHVCVNAVGYQL